MQEVCTESQTCSNWHGAKVWKITEIIPHNFVTTSAYIFSPLFCAYRLVIWLSAPASTVAPTIIWHGCYSPLVTIRPPLLPVSCIIVLLMLRYVFKHFTIIILWCRKRCQSTGVYPSNFNRRPKLQSKRKTQMMAWCLSSIHRICAMMENAMSICNIMDEWRFHFLWLLLRESKTLQSSLNGVHISQVSILKA